MRHARIVITDSGGIQEETTVLGVPCITVRENTERPITVEIGTNVLVGSDPGRIRDEAARILARSRACPPRAAPLGREDRGTDRRHSRTGFPAR